MILNCRSLPSTSILRPPGVGLEFNVTAVPLHWAYNPMHTVYILNPIFQEQAI